MVVSALILVIVLIIFTLGKSPVFRVDRAGAAIIGATVTIATGVLSFDQAARMVDYRTVVLLFAMMIVTSYLNLTGFFQVLGDYTLNRFKSQQQLLLAVILLTGVLSAFLINDIVCLLFTPVVITVCRRAKINPVPFLLGVAVASNLGSAATLIGNPQNILIGSLAHLSFLWYMGVALPLALFGLVLAYLILVKSYHEELQVPLAIFPAEIHFVHRGLIRKGLAVLLLVVAGFVSGFEPAVVAALGAAVLLVTRRIKPNKVYAGIDFNLLVIFIGLFVIVGGIEQSGLLTRILGTKLLYQGLHLPEFIALTVILSNVVSNVPAVMLLKFVIPATNSAVWWANLAIFSTIAGNLTITGSIANLIVVELAKKNGIKISSLDYVKIGLPLTLVLTLSGLGYFLVFFAR
ncbi:MAG TPA: SLC13 family permease [Desulfobacteria bacterium]|nr:SLC13 family permease [Desulfobacteria bacterium]